MRQVLLTGGKVFFLGGLLFWHQLVSDCSNELTNLHLILSPKKKTTTYLGNDQMSRVVGKPAFCICKNKEADQLRGNLEADQCLCFRYTDSTFPLLPKSEISSL